MNCPKCNSPDTQKFSILYESGSSVGSFGGAGVGASRTGFSGSLFGGTTQTQTLLARRVAPPPHPPNAPDSGPGVIWAGMLLLGIAVVLFLLWDSINAKELILLAILSVGCGLLALLGTVGGKSAAETRRRLQERMERWRNSWLCLRCGQEFVESPSGGVICESVDSRTKHIRDTEGLIAAIKYYRGQRDVGLADAKDYVEKL